MAHHRQALVFVCLVLSVSTASAVLFKVGGTGEWKVPTGSNAKSFYDQWAERNRFRVGDSIAFSYHAGNDSVLLVDMKSHSSCDTSSYIDWFTDGNTVFTFSRSGPFYFISGNKDNCNQNEKLVVVVMAERGNTSTTTALAPSPSSFSTSPPRPSSADISPALNAAASSKAAGLAGTAVFAIASLFYALA